MQPTLLFRPALLVLAMALAGCSLAPSYQRPEAPVAASWNTPAAAPDGATAEALDWQTFILDPELRQVVEAALGNNRNLRQALLDIEAARAQYRVQRADRLPSINANASGNRQRLPSDQSLSGRSEVASTYQVGLGLTEYELDLLAQHLHRQVHADSDQHRTADCPGRSVQGVGRGLDTGVSLIRSG